MHDNLRRADLVYDFGLHRGEDTEFYLKKGFRVVAFEANPDLVDACMARFQKEVADGSLVIIHGAVVDTQGEDAGLESVRFYRNNDMSIWGTVNKDWADRNSSLGSGSTVIEVPVVNLEKVVLEYGMPYFMKIDIEGCDTICLRMLERFQSRPAFVSFESDKTSLANIRQEIALLMRLGYDRFQAVEQSSIEFIQRPPNPSREGRFTDHRFEHGSSGLFGTELPGTWSTANRVLRKYVFIRLGYYLLGDAGRMTSWAFPGAGLLRGAVRRGIRVFTGAPVPGWYDTHARNTDAFCSEKGERGPGAARSTRGE